MLDFGHLSEHVIYKQIHIYLLNLNDASRTKNISSTLSMMTKVDPNVPNKEEEKKETYSYYSYH